MNPHALSQRQPSLVLFPVFGIFLAVCVVGAASGARQNGAKEEREIRDEIPAHLPVKFKIKNPEKAQDLTNEDWLRDIEIEVKNTGTKPIYFLRFSLSFVDVEFSPGERYGFALAYGRPQLVDFAEPLTPEDVPLMPGETHVFRVPESIVKGWKNHKTREHKPHPKKIGLIFHELNFGDGTGFATTGGLPVPNLPKKSSIKGEGGNTAARILGGWQGRPLEQALQLTLFLPADFAPVNFSPATSGGSMREITFPQTCCPNTPCQRMKTVFGGNCFCPDMPPPTHVLTDHSCNDPAAFCGSTVTESSECGVGTADYHTCTIFYVGSCGSTPPPPAAGGVAFADAVADAAA